MLEGTLNAIGLTQENARESVESIEIGADQVDNFLASGPHEGEIFMGTRQQNDQLESMSLGSGQIWRAYFLGSCHPWGVTHGVKTTDAFPQMQAYTGGSMSADVRLGIGAGHADNGLSRKARRHNPAALSSYGGSPKGLSPLHARRPKGSTDRWAPPTWCCWCPKANA